IKPYVQVISWLVTAILVYLNIRMVINEASSFFASSSNIFWEILIIAGGALFLGLLAYIIFNPLFSKKSKADADIQLHRQIEGLQKLAIPSYQKIAVALDFGEHDDT